MVKPAAPTTEHLNGLRARGMTREQMAAECGVSVARIKRWIKDLDVAKRPTKDRTKAPDPFVAVAVALDAMLPPDEKPKPLAPTDAGKTVMERAKMLLGNRLGERAGIGYTLDGRPTNTDQIIRAAKKVRNEQMVRDFVAQNFAQQGKPE